MSCLHVVVILEVVDYHILRRASLATDDACVPLPVELWRVLSIPEVVVLLMILHVCP